MKFCDSNDVNCCACSIISSSFFYLSAAFWPIPSSSSCLDTSAFTSGRIASVTIEITASLMVLFGCPRFFYISLNTESSTFGRWDGSRLGIIRMISIRTSALNSMTCISLTLIFSGFSSISSISSSFSSYSYSSSSSSESSISSKSESPSSS